MKTTIRLTESAVMLAAALVLSMIPLVNMPYGGSVTLCSMLPVCLIAYRHGSAWGLLVGVAGALLQLLTGLNNLSYATSAGAAAAIILLDYIGAFTCLGLAGIFRRTKLSQPMAFGGGILLVCLIRFVFHTIAGCTVWAGVSIPTAHGLVYSLVYNAAYMVPETIVTLAAGCAIAATIDLTHPRLRPIAKENSPLAYKIALVIAIAAAGVATVMLFGAMQTEDGFDVTAITGHDVIVVAIAAAVAVIGTVAAVIAKKRSSVK